MNGVLKSAYCMHIKTQRLQIVAFLFNDSEFQLHNAKLFDGIQSSMHIFVFDFFYDFSFSKVVLSLKSEEFNNDGVIKRELQPWDKGGM